MQKAIKARVVIDFEDDVFRDIVLPANTNFEVFHEQILKAFNFPNNQMASFYLSNDNWDKGQEIPLFDMSDTGAENLSTMKEVKLQALIENANQKLVYVYDFFLMWCFFVEIISIEKSDIQLPEITTSYGTPPNPNDKAPIDAFTFEEDFSVNQQLNEDDEDDDLFDEFSDGYDDDDFR